jgi:hypothetical protein
MISFAKSAQRSGSGQRERGFTHLLHEERLTCTGERAMPTSSPAPTLLRDTGLMPYFEYVRERQTETKRMCSYRCVRNT